MQYKTSNIQVFLDKNNEAFIGEFELYSLLSDFSCPKNLEVEHFIKSNAIEFTKKKQSVTYIVSDNEANILGFFALTIKPVSVRASKISKTMSKKLARTSVYNENTKTYSSSAYLIAQLGKNYAIEKEKRISGNDLLNVALEKIEEIQYQIGGVTEFLECEENEFLISFYTSKGFKIFDSRKSEAGKVLYQLIKVI